MYLFSTFMVMVNKFQAFKKKMEKCIIFTYFTYCPIAPCIIFDTRAILVHSKSLRYSMC